MTRFIMVFTAPWCRPCVALKRDVIEYLPKDQVVLVDCDDQPEIAIKARIEKLPTTVYYESGAEKHRKIGMIDKEQTIRWLGEVTDDID